MRAIIGTKTFSSKCPCIPPTAIAASLPITWAATWVTTSGITGLTLPGMIELPFWSSGQEDLAEAGARARPHQPQVVGDLRQRDGDDLQRAGGLDEAVARGLGLERVGRRARPAGPSPRAHARARARANSGCVFRPVPTAVPPSGIWPSRSSVASSRRPPCAHLGRVAAELLAERHRHGVHQVRAAGLDDVVELARLRLERLARAARAPAGDRSTSSSSAARWTADGKTSFDDWPMLTSSFACTSSPASVAITSFAFMFDDVPEPVWKTSIGNWSSSSPRATRSPAAAMRSALSASSSAERGVHAGRRRLEPAEPARDGDRNRLAGDREVPIALRVSAPQSSRSVSVSVTAPSLAEARSRGTLVVMRGTLAMAHRRRRRCSRSRPRARRRSSSSLLVTHFQPVTVSGAGFDPSERVVVTVVSGKAKHVRAVRRAKAASAFASTSARRCAADAAPRQPPRRVRKRSGCEASAPRCPPERARP